MFQEFPPNHEIIVVNDNSTDQSKYIIEEFQKAFTNPSFDPKNNHLTFFTKNTEIGESSETLSSRISGGSLDISFNYKYLSTILSLTQAESISLTASGIGRPLIMKGVGDNSLLYLISPMNQ